MTTHPAALTAQQITQMMEEIQHFIDHPRIQQKRWVEKGRTWLPLLQHARAHLLACVGQNDPATAPTPTPEGTPRLGLEIHPRDQTTWGYSWNGAPLVGNYPSLMQALEAALREQLPKR